MVKRDQLVWREDRHGAKLNILKNKLFLSNASLPFTFPQIEWNIPKALKLYNQIPSILFFKIAFTPTLSKMQDVPLIVCLLYHHHFNTYDHGREGEILGLTNEH